MTCGEQQRLRVLDTSTVTLLCPCPGCAPVVSTRPTHRRPAWTRPHGDVRRRAWVRASQVHSTRCVPLACPAPRCGHR